MFPGVRIWINVISGIYALLLIMDIRLVTCAYRNISRTKPDKDSVIQNISKILDTLLDGYDQMLRPGFGGAPTVIKTDINIRSMGPIDEVDVAYSMDCYFRQYWTDKRLRFKGPKRSLPVHISILKRIWKPDTFFQNGRGSYLHMITTPNKLLRINEDGQILYSMRLTIKASCPMYLEYFPIDNQVCPLIFGSYAYNRNDVVYEWRHSNRSSVEISRDMRLSQFDLTDYPQQNFTIVTEKGEYSIMRVQFKLTRHMGYFLIQVYVPCILIVVLSWVSFWLNREATADRIGLGITTVLTLTTLQMDSRQNLPKVAYATALDWFVVMCFVFIIASMFEFAGVHYFTKVGYGEMPHCVSDSEDSEEEEEAEVLCNQNSMHYYHGHNHTSNNYSEQKKFKNNTNAETEQIHFRQKRSVWYDLFHCLQGNQKYRNLIIKSRRRQGVVNSVSLIDRVSRVLFPLAFGALNVAYWVAYTKSDPRIEGGATDLHFMQ
ncbi:gamma-aminobutyric acid receptor subunit alpha-5-like [Lineus longissimus]|uniref:gamma-aminobutyric acid receptor subunit alpha-5-like n=1 Tax=Lineus longissimus TaxID=88925 RepID=UPI00315DE554